MAEFRYISEIEPSLEETLKRNEIDFQNSLVFAAADMDINCDFREHILLLCKNTLIHGYSNKLTEEHIAGRIKEKEKDYDGFSFKTYNVQDIKSPSIDTLIVGGIFRFEYNGQEVPLLSFTNSYMGRMKKLLEILNNLINNEEIKEDAIKEKIVESFCPKCSRPYPNPERQFCPHCSDKRKIFFRLASFFAPYKFQLIIISIFCIFNALMSSLWPLLNGTYLYDAILGNNSQLLPIGKNITDYALLLLLLVSAMVGAKILQQIFGILQGRMVATIVPNVMATIKNQVFKSVQLLSVSFFTDRKTGNLMSRITSDATSVSDIFIDGIPQILPNLFTIIFSCYVMFSTNWILATVAVFTLPIAVLISLKLNPILWHLNSKNFQTLRDFRSKLNDNITGARVVKAFGREESEAERIFESSERVAQSQRNTIKFDIKFTLLYRLASSLSSIFTWTVGAFFVIAVFKPQLSLGTLITFIGYVSLLSGPTDFFSYIFRRWSVSMNSAQRIFEILDAKPDVIEKANPIKHKIEGEIELKNVTFGYEENIDVLKNISIKIEKNKMLGIVGKSGAGKTTLVNLITRLYDTKDGEILFDGIPIKDLALENIRKNVALVSQETYIFKGTIFDNIAYANKNASRKDVIEAAISASAHDFICALPDGYDTAVGAGGRSLSGGEKQRISIARAILANPKILILDEATAAVDTETEKKIQESLSRLIKNRTTISIAHRLSTLRNADYLIVIENGEITERGTHMELVKEKGTYYKLLQIQNKALAMRGIGN